MRPLHSRYPSRRNNEKDRGFSLSPRGSGGTDTMGPMTCYNCALAAQRGLLPASCQFECPIAFTLEARDGAYALHLECARSFSYRRSLSRREDISLGPARSRRTGDTRLFRCESIKRELRSYVRLLSAGREIKIAGMSVRDTFNIHLNSRC